LFVRPSDCPVYYLDFFEISLVLQFPKNAETQEGSTVVHPYLTIGKGEDQTILIGGNNGFYSRIHELPQRFDLVKWLTIDRELPIGHEVILVNFYPGLDELHLIAWNFSLENFSIGNGYNGFVLLIFHMYMWPVMLLVINIIKGDNNPIKHRYNGHTISSYKT